jgi:outer membrane protein OmpA-like peptidoglycan-associated protein
MSKQACKCKEVECEECPEWIFTLADLIMCMMGLFVILWVLKPSAKPVNPDQQRLLTDNYNEALAEIRGGFGWEPDPQSHDPVDQAMIRRRLRNQGKGEGGKTTVKRQGAEGTDPEVTTVRLGKTATAGGRLLFAVGDATLSKEVKAELDQVVEEIRGHRNVTLVKGHTGADDLPETATGQEKMGLSIRRAQAVADYLIAKGVSPEVLRVQGCSTFEPVVERAYTPDVRAMNRRVEVEATSTIVSELQDPPRAEELGKGPQQEGAAGSAPSSAHGAGEGAAGH